MDKRGCSCHPDVEAQDRPNVFIDIGNLPETRLELKPGQKVMFVRPLAIAGQRTPRVLFPPRHFMWDYVPQRTGFPGQPEDTEVVAMAVAERPGLSEIGLLPAPTGLSIAQDQPARVQFCIEQ